MSGVWLKAWLDTTAGVKRDIWRGVEAQHVVATMRLVDSVHEQQLLEELLDASKPEVAAPAKALHYLLFTPFRYASPISSRFRRSHDKGVFYGADSPRTVAAELAHWRWRFLMDSDGLRTRELESVHTFFLARLRGTELDLTMPPWNTKRHRWRDPSDYDACHALAAHLREFKPHIVTVRYESARLEEARCNVVFDPAALSLPKLHLQQTWTCKTTARRVIWEHDRDLLEFEQPQ